MKIKSFLLTIFVLLISCFGLVLTGCQGVYENVKIFVESDGLTNGVLELEYEYEDDAEDGQKYTLTSGSNEVLVKIDGLEDDMPVGVSYKQTNDKLLNLSFEKLQKAGEYKVAVNPYTDSHGNIIKGGSTKITFISDAGNKQAALNVNITIKLSNIAPTSNKSLLYVVKDEKTNLSSKGFVDYLPANTTQSGVTYSATQPGVAIEKDASGNEYLTIDKNFTDSFVKLTAKSKEDSNITTDVKLAVLPSKTGEDIKIIDSAKEEINSVTLYNVAPGLNKELAISTEFEHEFRVTYSSSNNNIATVVDLTGQNETNKVFSIEYNQEGQAEIYVTILFEQYNYTITKTIGVDCVMLPSKVSVSQDDNVLEDDEKYILYDHYNRSEGSKINIQLGNSNVLAQNKRFIVLFKTEDGGSVNDILNINGTENYLDISNLLGGKTLTEYVKKLKLEDIENKVLNSDSNFNLKALKVGKRVQMIIVPYAYLLAKEQVGEEIIKGAPIFEVGFETTVGADSVSVLELDYLDNNVYYILNGEEEELSFALHASQSGASAKPVARSAKLYLKDEQDSQYLEFVDYSYENDKQVVKVKGVKITSKPIAVMLVLDNGVTSEEFNIFVYSTLEYSDVVLKGTTNTNNNSSLGAIVYDESGSLQSVDIAKNGSLGIRVEYKNERTVRGSVQYDIYDYVGNKLNKGQITINGSVLQANSPIKNAIVTYTFKTYSFEYYGKVEEIEITKSFSVTVFEGIKSLAVQKQDAITKEYENINSFTLYYSDNQNMSSDYFSIMDYYSYTLYGLATANVRVNFDNFDNVNSFGNVQYNWAITPLAKTTNGESLKLTNRDLRNCKLEAYRNSNNLMGAENEVLLTCSVKQYNKIYTISVVVVLKDAKTSENLLINNQDVYLEMGNNSLQTDVSDYQIYRRDTTNKNLDYVMLWGNDCVEISYPTTSQISFKAKNGGTAAFVMFATDSTKKSATAYKQIWKDVPSADDMAGLQYKTPAQIEETLKTYLTDGLIYKVIKVKVADGLTEQTAYNISSKADFEKITTNGLDKWYIVTEDIDLGVFAPIGSASEPFTGGLVGEYNGRTSTIYFSQKLEEAVNNYGLFAKTEYATIKNINFNYTLNGEKELTTSLYVGAITGYATQSKQNAFQNIKVTIGGEITLTYAGNQKAYIGGAVGVNDFEKYENSSLTNVSVENNLTFNAQEKTGATVTSAGLYVGGVLGANFGGLIAGNFTNKHGVYTYTYVTGNLTVNSTTEFGEQYVGIGGVAGLNESDSHYHIVEISGYYSDININASTNNVGGIVGLNCGSVKDSLFCGTLVGKDNVGGIIGLAETSVQADHYGDLTLEYLVTELLTATKQDVIKGANNVGGLIGKIGTDKITDVFDAQRPYEAGSVGYTILASYVKAYSNTLKIVATTTETNKYVAGFVGCSPETATKTVGANTVTISNTANVCSASVTCVTRTGSPAEDTPVQNFNNGTLTLTNYYNNTSGKNEGTIANGYYLTDVSNYSDPVVLVYNGYILGKISPSSIVAIIIPPVVPESGAAPTEYELMSGVTAQKVGEAGGEIYVIKILNRKTNVNFFIPLDKLLLITNGEAQTDTSGNVTNLIPFSDLRFKVKTTNAKIVVNGLYITEDGEIEIAISSKYSDVSAETSLNFVYGLEKYELLDATKAKATITVGGSEKPDQVSIKIKQEGSVNLFESINEDYTLTNNIQLRVKLVNNNTQKYFTLNGVYNDEGVIERSLNYILKLTEKSNSNLYIEYYAFKIISGKEVQLSPTAYIELIVYKGATDVRVDDADEIRINATSTSFINVDVATDDAGQELVLQMKVGEDIVKFNESDKFTANSSGNVKAKLGTLEIFEISYNTLSPKTGTKRFSFTITPLVYSESLTATLLFTADDYSDDVTIISDPVDTTNISINHYTSFQNGGNKDEYLFNVNENTSYELAPGEFGLIVADIYPEDALFDDIIIEYEAQSANLSFTQVVQSIDTESSGNISLNSAYKIVYPTATVLPNGKGVKLNKLSLLDNNGVYYFNGKVYVAVLCNSSAGLDQYATIRLSTIRYNEDGSVGFTKTATKQLLIKAQAVVNLDVANKVEVLIENTNYILAPVGCNLDLIVTTQNTSASVSLNIGYLDEFGVYKDLNTAYKPYLDSLSNKVVVNFLCETNKRFYITATVLENKNGVYKEYTKVLYFITTEFTVSSVYVNGFNLTNTSKDSETDYVYTNGEIEILQGARYDVLAKINARRGICNENNIQYTQAQNLVKSFNTILSLGNELTTEQKALFEESKKIVEYCKQREREIDQSILNFELEISNCQITVPEGNGRDNFKYIWFAKMNANNQTTNISVGKTVGFVEFLSGNVNGVNVFNLIGKQVGTSTSLILSFAYGLLDGAPSVYATNGITGNKMEFVGEITIISSNTLDTPTPVYTKEDLYNMQNNPDKHYILMNNLDLTSGFNPIPGNFASFDGNGYTITITNIQIPENANNIGFFTTIEEGAVVKNLNIMYRNGDFKNYTMKVDLTKNTSTVNFGLFAGSNQGIINNCRVVPYLTETEIATVTIEIQTTSNASVNFGGFVGDNKGQILYSNISNTLLTYNSSPQKKYLLLLANGSTVVATLSDIQSETYKNYKQLNEYTEAFLSSADLMETVMPAFNVIGSGSMAGFVSQNNNGGKIVSSFAKNVSIYNISSSISSAKTAGFVAQNAGEIHESFVEGYIDSEKDYTPAYNQNLMMTLTTLSGETVKIYTLPYIYSKTNIGGFVFENSSNSIIHNSYASINLFTNARSGGFVFNNAGEILNSYTNSVNADEENSSAHTYFTGTNNLSVVNNTGSIEYCYYVSKKDIIADGIEYEEPASQIKTSTPGRYGNFDIEGIKTDDKKPQQSVWGFQGEVKESEPGVAIIGEESRFDQVGRPVLNSTISVTLTQKRLNSFEVFNNQITTCYFNDTTVGVYNNHNPILVSNAEEFLNAIFEKGSTKMADQFAEKLTIKVNPDKVGDPAQDEEITGYSNSVETLSQNYYHGYIRLIGDINFDVNLDEISDKLFTQKRAMLSKIIYAGVLDGCYHSISGLTLTSSVEDTSEGINNISNYAFGMFAQVGLSSYAEYKTSAGNKYKEKSIEPNLTTIVKNLELNVKVGEALQEIGNKNTCSVGVLAGEAVNARLTNILINGNEAVLLGHNYVGGLVGRLSENSKAESITVSNLSVSAQRVNLPAESGKGYDYSDWKLPEEETENNAAIYTSKYIYVVEGNSTIQKPRYLRELSQAFAENNPNSKTTGVVTSYAGGAIGIVDIKEDNLVKNINVNGNITVFAEFAGGVIGFVAEGNKTSQLVFVVNTDENSQNIQGLFASGGLVALNKGEIEKSTLEATKEITLQIEEQNTGYYASTLFKPVLKNGRQSLSKFAGGIAGINYGSITLSYAKSPVVNVYCSYVGGLVGANVLTTHKALKLGKSTVAAKLDQVYTMGNVEASNLGSAGGVIGLYIINNGEDFVDKDSGFTQDNLANIVALNMFKTNRTNVGAVFGEIKIAETSTIDTCENTYYNIAKDWNTYQGGTIVEEKDKLNKWNKLTNIDNLKFASENEFITIFDSETTKNANLYNLYYLIKTNPSIKIAQVFPKFSDADWERSKYLYPRLVINAKSVFKEIATDNDLRNIDANGSYILVNDIYLSHDWIPLEFNGMITSKAKSDGTYCSIYNINIAEEAFTNASLEEIGFFSTSTGAYILNINFHIGGNSVPVPNSDAYNSEYQDNQSNWFDGEGTERKLKLYSGLHTTGYKIGHTTTPNDNAVIHVGGLAGLIDRSLISNCSVKFVKDSYYITDEGNKVKFFTDLGEETYYEKCTDAEGNVYTEEASPSSIEVGKSNVLNVGGFVGNSSDSTLFNNKVLNAKLVIKNTEKFNVESAGSETSITTIGGFIGQSSNSTAELSNLVENIEISHETESGDVNNYQEGLFIGGVYGYLQNSNESNIAIKASNIIIEQTQTVYNSNSTSIGGFAGKLNAPILNINIENVNILTNTINSTNVNIGGFVGEVSNNVTLTSCSVYSVAVQTNNTSETDSAQNNIGGFAGYLSGGANLTGCGAYGFIKTEGKGVHNIGGFVGQVLGASISNSFSNVSIQESLTSGNLNLGGFVGCFTNTNSTTTSLITNCYSVGSAIVANSSVSNYYIGGFVGYMGEQYVTITYCYTITSIYANNYLGSTTVGGFAGLLEGDASGQANYYIHNLALVENNNIGGYPVTRDELNTALNNSTAGADNYTTNKTYYPYMQTTDNVLKCLGYDSSKGAFIQGTRINPFTVHNIGTNFDTDRTIEKINTDFNNKDMFGASYYAEHVFTTNYTINIGANLTINGLVNFNGYTVTLDGGAEFTVNDTNKITLPGSELTFTFPVAITGAVINLFDAERGTVDTSANNTAFEQNEGTIFNTLVSTFKADTSRVFTSVKASDLISGFVHTNTGTIIASGTNAKFDLNNNTISQNINGFVNENSGTIYNCYSTAEFTNINTANTISGFVYNNTNDGTIKNSYTAMLYVCSANADNQYYFQANGTGEFYNCYADINSMPYAKTKGLGTGMFENISLDLSTTYNITITKTLELQTKLTKVDSFENAWQTNTAYNFGYPILKDFIFNGSDENGSDEKRITMLSSDHNHSANNIVIITGGDDDWFTDNALYTGNGTDTNNAYQITHAGMISALNNNYNKKLIDNTYLQLEYDIDMYTYTTSDKAAPAWSTITFGSNNVELNGQNFQIKNLKLQKTTDTNGTDDTADDTTHLGLFRSNANITINNLAVLDVGFGTVNGYIKYASVLVSTCGNEATFENVFVNVAPESVTLNVQYFGALIGSCGPASAANGGLNATNCFVNVNNLSFNCTSGWFYVGYLAGCVRAGTNNKIDSCTTLGTITLKAPTTKRVSSYYVGGMVGYESSSLTITSSSTMGQINISALSDVNNETFAESDTDKNIRVGGFVGKATSLTLTNSYTVLTIEGINYTNSYIKAGGFVGSDSSTVNKDSSNCYYDSSYTKTIAYYGIDSDCGDKDDKTYDTNANNDNKGIDGSAINLASSDFNNDNWIFAPNSMYNSQLPILNWLKSDSATDFMGTKNQFSSILIYQTKLQEILNPYVDYDSIAEGFQQGAKFNPVKIGIETDLKNYSDQSQYAVITENIKLTTAITNDYNSYYLMGGGKTISYTGAYPFDKFTGYMANVKFEREVDSGNTDFAGVANELNDATLFKIDVNITNPESFKTVTNFGGIALEIGYDGADIIDCCTGAESNLVFGNNYAGMEMSAVADTTQRFVGGIVCEAKSVLNIAYTENKLSILIKSTYAEAGGFVSKIIDNGMRVKLVNNTNNGEIASMFIKKSQSVNIGGDTTQAERPVPSKHLLAGFVARTTRSKVNFINCINEGYIDNRATQVGYSGGFIAFAIMNSTATELNFTNCINNNSVWVGSSQDFIKLSKEDYEAINDEYRVTVPYASPNNGNKDEGLYENEISDNSTPIDYSIKINISTKDGAGYQIGNFYKTDSVAAAGGFIGHLYSYKDIKIDDNPMFSVLNTNYGTVGTDTFTTLKAPDYNRSATGTSANDFIIYKSNGYTYGEYRFLDYYFSAAAERKSVEEIGGKSIEIEVLARNQSIFETTNMASITDRCNGIYKVKSLYKVIQNYEESITDPCISNNHSLLQIKGLTLHKYQLNVNGYPKVFWLYEEEVNGKTELYSIYLDLTHAYRTTSPAQDITERNLFALSSIDTESTITYTVYKDGDFYYMYGCSIEAKGNSDNYINDYYIPWVTNNLKNTVEFDSKKYSIDEYLTTFMLYTMHMDRSELDNDDFIVNYWVRTGKYAFDFKYKNAGGAIGRIYASGYSFEIENFTNGKEEEAKPVKTITVNAHNNKYHWNGESGKDATYKNAYAGGVVGYVNANSVIFKNNKNYLKIESSVYATGIAYVNDDCESATFDKSNASDKCLATTLITNEYIKDLYYYSISNKTVYTINWDNEKIYKFEIGEELKIVFTVDNYGFGSATRSIDLYKGKDDTGTCLVWDLEVGVFQTKEDVSTKNYYITATLKGEGDAYQADKEGTLIYEFTNLDYGTYYVNDSTNWT